MRITRRTTERFACRSVALRHGGFTLLEVSAVIFIITILVSLLCAALNHTKSKALRISCLDNLKHLQQARWLYAAENDEALPLNQTATGDDDSRSSQTFTSNDSWVAGSPLLDLSTDNIAKGTLF